MAPLVVHAFDGEIEDVEHPFAGGAGGLQKLIQTVQLADGVVEQPEIKKKRDQFAGGQLVVDTSQPPTHRISTMPSAAAKLMAGEYKAHTRMTPRVVWRRPSARSGEARVFVGFLAKGFDLADALEIVHQQRIHGAGSLALRAIAAMSG